jgi:hypothetical protein
MTDGAKALSEFIDGELGIKPKKSANTKKHPMLEFIDKEIDRAISEGKKGKGEQSETNLEDSINALVAANSGQPIVVSLGDFGKRRIQGARKVTGTPKTDVLFVAGDSAGDIGISMKLPSADFLDNRRTQEQMWNAVEKATASTRAADFFVSTLLSGINGASLDWIQSPYPKAEKSALESAVRTAAKKYKLGKELEKYKLEWDEGGVTWDSLLYPLKEGSENELAAFVEIAASFKATAGGLTGIPANAFRLQHFFEPDEYSQFLDLILGGTQQPPEGANAFFHGDIDRGDYSLEDLEAAFNKPWGDVKSFTTIPNARQELQDKYVPSFRLRAITPARAALSKTNASHHRKGMVDQESGLGWTTFIVK